MTKRDQLHHETNERHVSCADTRVVLPLPYIFATSMTQFQVFIGSRKRMNSLNINSSDKPLLTHLIFIRGPNRLVGET